MTLVNSWWEPHPSGDREVRWGLVQCDGCATGRWPIGTPEIFRAKGWRLDDLESGPHLCPQCANRGGSPEPAPERPALPNLLVIGAVKCGTTSLHSYLGMHPEIRMSQRKELNFFHSSDCLDELGSYASHFDGDAPVRGESSPIYTYHPITRGVPQRIRAATPDVRLVYLVRDPVERFVSHYVQRRARGKESLDLHAAVGEIDNPYNQYMVPSRYATQLEQYLDVFPPEQLLVIDQADLRADRNETLRKVFRFVGVDDRFVSPDFEVRHNIAERKRRSTATGTLLRKSRLADTVRLLPPTPRQALFSPARRVLSRSVKPPALDDAVQRRLRQVFGEEVRRLRDMTGQEFATWNASAA